MGLLGLDTSKARLDTGVLLLLAGDRFQFGGIGGAGSVEFKTHTLRPPRRRWARVFCVKSLCHSKSHFGQSENHDMTDNQHSNTQEAPPHAQLIEMATAHWVSHIAYVAAKLSLADHLAQGPKSADELAGPTRTHAPSLYRFMRTLASFGIVTED